jgi:N-acetylated-alpha-linked acidic dipeptidase
LWGLLALRFADADLLPFDYSLYPNEVAGYLRELERSVPSAFAESDIKPLIEKCKQWQDAAERLTAAIAEHRSEPPAAANVVELSQPDFAGINTALMAEERALLDPDGIPNRPWFRHVIYAPLPTYDAESVPGLREAIEARDWNKAHEEAERIGRALDRATQAAKLGD